MKEWKMSRHWLVSVLVSVLILSPGGAAAYQEPAQAPLPNLDRRRLAGAKPQLAAAPQAAAAAQLQQRVPGLRVEWDELLGSPSFICAPDGFLSGPNGTGRAISAERASALPADDPHRPIKAFVREHAALFGHGDEALAAARVVRDYATLHNGLRTVAWQQRLEDIPVVDALLVGHITQKGELVNLSSRFVPQLEQAANAGAPGREAQRAKPIVTATAAIVRAAESLGENLGAEDIIALDPKPEGPEQRQRFKAGRTPGKAEASLVWLPLERSLVRLCWRVELNRSGVGDRYCLFVDAQTGEPLVRRSQTFYLTEASYRVFPSDSPSPFSPAYPAPTTNQPPLVPRALVTLPALSTNASPIGWISDGENETRGNNVDAHLDRDANNEADLPRPRGSPFRVFDPPLDLSQEPGTYGEAAVVNLFYWCNWMHDRLYELGFTEAAGNFQKDNFGRGGVGNDPMLANAQDGASVNNARFFQANDGTAGRMEMFVFDGPRPNRDGAFDAEVILHEYTHGLSSRLVGGGTGIYQLQTAGLSEGWSDFYALALLSEPGDELDGNYPEGGYVTFGLRGLDQNYYFGIRRYPYSTDLSRSPLTFKDIDSNQIGSYPGVPRSPIRRFDPTLAGEVHYQGEVWCGLLWEARANLIRKYGFDAGNRLILQLVTDGMKLGPPEPTFTQARDAILQADVVNNEGANLNELWAAFAKRGLGLGAVSPPNWATDGVRESYSVPDPMLITPASPALFSGPPGGEFSPVCRVYRITNGSAASVDWNLRTTMGWLSAFPTNGTLAAGAATDVAVCLSGDAYTLPAGRQQATLLFSNLTAGQVQTRLVRLDVLAVAAMPFVENLEEGALREYWSKEGSGPSRVLVTADQEPQEGNYHVTLDSPVDGAYARNELTLAIDLAGYTNVVLRFWAKEFTDEPHGPPPSPFVERANFDGVAISADGLTWFEAQGLRGLSDTYSDLVVDLDAAVARQGLAYNSAFRIRFNQYGNRSLPNDGLALDAVQITGVAPRRLAVTLPPLAEEGEGILRGAGRVSLPQPVASDLTVSLATSDDSEMIVPANATILAGRASATFDLRIMDDGELDGSQSATITASAAGYLSGRGALVIRDNETALMTIAVPATAREGDGTLVNRGHIFVNLAPSKPISVGLTSSDPTEVRVPQTVIIPAGQTQADFSLDIVDDQAIDGPQTNFVTARVENWVGDSDVIVVLDNEVTALRVVLPSLLAEGAAPGAAVSAVQIPGSLPTNLVVTLASSDTNTLLVPATVTIFAGQISAALTITLPDDNQASSARTVTVTARAPGFVPGAANVRWIDTDAAPMPYSPSPRHRSANNALRPTLTWKLGFSEVVQNGDFETGDLRGWLSEDSAGGSFVLDDGTVDPPGPEGPMPPLSGRFSVVSMQSAPGLRTLYQDIGLPVMAGAITLNWSQRVRNFGPRFAPEHGFRVEVRDLADSVVAMAFATREGDPLLGHWEEHTFDLTDYRGQRVRIAFVEEDTLGFLNVHLDNVRVMLSYPGLTASDVYFGTNAALGTAAYQGTTTSTSWEIPPLAQNTTSYWQVLSRRGAQTAPGPVWQFETRGLGPVDHFAWGPLASTQQLDHPFGVSITAKDDLENTVTNFAGAVALSARQEVPAESVQLLSFVLYSDLSRRYRRAIGAIATYFTNFSESTTMTTDPAVLQAQLLAKDVFLIAEQGTAPAGSLAELAKAWAPVLSNFVARGGLVIACSYQKDEHLILADSGLLSLARVKSFPSLELAGGTNHPLMEGVTTPFVGREVATYEAINGDVVLRGVEGGNAVVVARNVGAGRVVMMGSDFPTNRTGFDRILANAVKSAQSSTTLPLPMTPTIAGYFVNGVWTGDLALRQTAGAVTLLADDGQGHLGATGPIRVTASNDLSVEISDRPDPAIGGTPIVYTVTVRNTGPSAAQNVVLTNRLPDALRFVSATATSGECVAVSNEVRCAFASLPGDSLAEVQIAAVPQVAGTIRNTVSVFGGPQEVYLANNTATAVTRVNFPSLSTSDATVSEGNEGLVAVVLTVSLAPASSQAVSCDYFTSDGIATAPDDYTAAAGRLFFPPGTTVQTVSVLVRGDRLNEGLEVFHVNLTNATNAVFSDRQGAVVMFDDDPPPTLSISDASVVEGGPGSTVDLQFIARLSAVSGQAVTVHYSTSNGTARAGSDYRAASNTVTFPPGTTEQAINVTVFGDNASESNETFTVTLSNPVNAPLTVNRATGTILDDDAGRLDHFTWGPIAPTQWVDAPFVATLTARDAFDQPVTDFAGTAFLSAVAGSQEFTIGAGTGTWEFPLAAYYHDARLQTIYLADEIGEPARLSALSLNVATPPGQMLKRWTIRFKHTAQDTVASPRWEQTGWTTVYQSDEVIQTSGWATFSFNQPFDFNGSDNLLVDLSFDNASYNSDGLCRFSATAQPRSLYLRTDSAFGDPLTWHDQEPAPTAIKRIPNLRLTAEKLAPNSPASVSNFVNGAWTGEVRVHEILSGLRLRATDGAGRFGTGNVFTVTALDDLGLRMAGPPAQVSLGEVVTYTLTVTNTGPNPATAVTITDRLPPGTAFVSANAAQGSCVRAGEVVTCQLGTVPGMASATAAIVVVPVATGFATNVATLARGEPESHLANNAVTNIVSVSPTRLFIDDATGVEGDSGVTNMIFTVRLSVPAALPVSVNYFTTNGSALAERDYLGAAGLVTFPPGTTTQQIQIEILGDILDETNELFSVNLSNAVNAILGDAQARGTILDDDPLPIVSISDTAVVEGNAGSAQALFNLRLSAPSAQLIRVTCTPSNGTALAGSDYQAQSLVALFAPNLTNRLIGVTVLGDRLVEADEWFLVNLSNPSNCVIGQAVAVGTILNDDGVPGAVEYFEWGPVPSPQTVRQPFPVTITARDYYNDPATNFTGPAALSGRAGRLDAIIGNSSSPAVSIYPLATGFHDARTQVIYLASELGAARRFTGLALDVALPPAQRMNQFTIRLKHTRFSSFTTNGWETADWTTVYQADALVLETGRVNFPFSTPFDYNGSNNVMVDFSFDNAHFTIDGACRVTATNVARTLAFQTDSQFGDPLNWSGTSLPPPSPSASFPNVTLIAGADIAIVPQLSGDFVSGRWTGEITVTEAATNMFLRVEDSEGHAAASSLFTVVPAGVDTDGDGLPDEWEIRYFGSTNAPQGGPEDDPDRDGLTNLSEYLAGTSPQDARSVLAITAIELLGTTVRISFSTVIGHTYRVERTDDLGRGPWSILADQVPGNGASVSVLDPAGAAQGNRFYRVRLLQ